jgi:nucleotide-binding universal stress UspA family protein
MSDYRTILVHLPDEARAAKTLAVATKLAIAHDAHLIGLFVMPPDIITPAFGYARGIVEAGRKALRQRAQVIAAMFESADAGLQIKKEWRFVEPGRQAHTEVIMNHARTADLIVVPQRNPIWDDTLLLECPEDIVMTSGRPTILVPTTGTIETIGKRITVAWNDRREAARATFDALPLLKKANNVRVLWINPEDEGSSPGDLPTAEIAATLARHGIRCTSAEARGSDLLVGEELLRQVDQDLSDLLVMGAYGRSRFREFVFGGATRTILNTTNVPVLLSH